MRLGLRLELYRAADLAVPMDQILRAEELGFHSVWTAEAYGSDALSPLAYVAALTSRIKLGTSVVQLAARPPTTLAMHAMTVDALAGGGRVIIGIGVSGPQIVEGWYGQPWGSPNARLRDYVTIMGKVLRRVEPVSHDGPQIALPYRGPGALGQGKALKSIMHPSAPIPIWLASGGTKNTELCAELCDGWLPMGLGPDGMEAYRPVLERGFSRRPQPPAAFDIFTGCSVTITDDVGAVFDAMRPLTAMYVGGMGSSTHNYHRDAMARRGFPEAAARIQELWLAGRKSEARAAVPIEYLEQSALVGSPAQIKQRWADDFAPLEATGVTGIIVSTQQAEALELMAELSGARDLTEG